MKVIFKFDYLGHELTVSEDQTVSYKGETFKLWQAPIPMRNDIEIAYMRRETAQCATVATETAQCATVATKDALGWEDLRKLGRTDTAGRWFPSIGSPVYEYLRAIRYPSRAYPLSYARAVMTKKFAKWFRTTCPAMAKEYGLS